MSAARTFRGLLLRVLILLAVPAAASPAVGAEYVGRTPPRLSLVDGQVSFWRSGSKDWEQAQLNLPLAPGDYLDTGNSSRAEMQIGGRAFVRASSDTRLGIQSQDTNLLRLDLPQGRLALDLRELSNGAHIEVTTPQATLNVSNPGLYDINVSAGSSSFVAYQGGKAKLLTDGDVVDLRSGSMVVAGAAAGGLARYDAPPEDDWARWNSERTDRILSASSRGNVSDEIYGIQDLDGQGTWRDEPTYGRVWVPSSVPDGWAPYTDGRWLWDVDYGWSWVDSSPWGWAPYHYGRWVWANSYWGWAPGPIVGAPIYSPALVAFFGGPSLRVGFGFPFVSWVALGWGEPIIPWWGPSWYRGHACWGGWGGPTIINNIYVNNRHTVDHIDHYHNQDVPHGVVAVRRSDFAQHRIDRLQMATDEQRRLRPTRDNTPVQPHEVGVSQGRGGSRPPRAVSPVDVASGPSHYGATETHSRSTLDLPNSRFGHSDANELAARQHRPVNDNSDLTGPRHEEAAAVPRSSTSAAPGSENLRRPPRPDRDQPATQEAAAVPRTSTTDLPGGENLRRPPRPDQSHVPARQTSVSSSDPRGGGTPRVERDSWSGTRPVMPQRPLPDRPSRPAQDVYAAPTYRGFDRAPLQREAQPQRPIPDRNTSYSAPSSGSFSRMPERRSGAAAEMPQVTQPRVEAPPAPRQRVGTDYGSRVQERPSAQQSMPMPSHSGGGNVIVGGNGSAPRGNPPAGPMPSSGVHPSHGH